MVFRGSDFNRLRNNSFTPTSGATYNRSIVEFNFVPGYESGLRNNRFGL